MASQGAARLAGLAGWLGLAGLIWLCFGWIWLAFGLVSHGFSFCLSFTRILVGIWLDFVDFGLDFALPLAFTKIYKF